MKNSKQEIISELKNKLSEFKSKINNKSDNTNPENDIMNMQININTIKNYYKAPKQDNNNIINKINPINEELQTDKKEIIINNKQDITNFQLSKTLKRAMKSPSSQAINDVLKRSYKIFLISNIENIRYIKININKNKWIFGLFFIFCFIEEIISY